MNTEFSMTPCSNHHAQICFSHTESEIVRDMAQSHNHGTFDI